MLATMRSILILCLLAGLAHADDASDAVKPLLERQAKAIAAGDAKAFAATFTDGAMAILPTAADEGIGRPAIEAAAKRWLATSKAPVKVDALKLPKQQMVGRGAWFDAAFVAGAVHWRVTGIVMHAHTADGSDGPFQITAYHLSEPADDSAVLAAAAEGTLPALPTLVDARTSGGEDPGKVVALFAKHVHAHPAVSMIGSAAKEHAIGASAVTKLLASWKALKLTTTGFVTGRDEDAMWGFEWSLGHVEATFTVKGKTVKVPYRALLIVSTPSAPAMDHGAAVELISAHYSAALH